MIKSFQPYFLSNLSLFNCVIRVIYGGIAERTVLSLNQEVVDEEAMYYGLYAICTNLEDRRVFCQH